MEFIDERLQRYCEQHTDPEPGVLKRINRETHLKVLKPRMLSGHFQGRVLSFLSKMQRPLHILEIGTYTGYSAICLAEGLQPGGKLTTIDCNEELEPFVRENFRNANLLEKIEFIVGDAKQVIPKLDVTFDLVFIDADKINYSLYYGMVFSKVSIGGLILADNVLWSGKVLDLSLKANDQDAHALLAFNKQVAEDQRVEKVLLPIRDGILMIRKIKE